HSQANGDQSDRPSLIQNDPLLTPGTTLGVLNLGNLFQLAVINSRDHQDLKDALFLAALDVTLEQYAFAPQFFLTQQATFDHIGRNLPGGDKRPNLVTTEPGPTANAVRPGRTAGSQASDGQTVAAFAGRSPLTGLGGALNGTGLGFGKLFWS